MDLSLTSTRRPISAEQRFWSKVEKTDTCWLWSASCNSDGYGQMKIDNKAIKAHRIAYELLVGVLPDGLEIDHLCKVRNCVNPTHLEAVTHWENVNRSGAWEVNRLKTHCKYGHEYTEENTYKNKNTRECRTCGRKACAKWRNKLRENK